MKAAGPGLTRIAYDLRRIHWVQGTGVHRFRDGLHAAIADMVVQELVLTDQPPSEEAPQARRPAIPLLTPPRLRYLHGDRTDQCVFPDVFRRAQSSFTLTGRMTRLELHCPPDIVHWSHPLPLFVPGAANIYTVHDLIPFEQCHLSGMSGARLARLFRQILSRAAHVTTVSETVRQALIDRFALERNRVTCCYQSIDAPGPAGALPPPLACDAFLLCLGRFEPRKNVARLIEAYRCTPMTLPLVFAGPDGDWPSERERRRVMAMIDGQNVIRLGWQDPDVVGALVAQCRALLMPSLAEGFGRPVVEAMRAGVPTMASRQGAGAEIAGDAALLVDPESVSEIAAGITSLVGDRQLRTDLQRKGVERAAHFSPKVFGDRLARLYEEVSGAPIRMRADDERGLWCA